MSESELYVETFLTLLFWDPVKNQKKGTKRNFHSDNITDTKADRYYVILTHRIKVSAMR